MSVIVETRVVNCRVTYLQKFLCGVYYDTLNLAFLIADNNRVKLFYSYGRQWLMRLAY